MVQWSVFDRTQRSAASMSSGANILTFEGCNYFRQYLVLSILSGKPIKIRKIRHKDDNPGLRGL